MRVFKPVDSDFIDERATNRANWSSLITADEHPSRAANGAIIVNGVMVAQTVIDQLIRHGDVPEWCTPYELQAAEQEALVGNATVFKDPGGNDFFDDLKLNKDEEEQDTAAEFVPEDEDEITEAQLIAQEQRREQERSRMRLRVQANIVRNENPKKDLLDEEPSSALAHTRFTNSFQKEEDRRRKRNKENHHKNEGSIAFTAA